MPPCAHPGASDHLSRTGRGGRDTSRLSGEEALAGSGGPYN